MPTIIPDCAGLDASDCGADNPVFAGDPSVQPLFFGSWDSIFCICSAADEDQGVCDQAPTVNWAFEDGFGVETAETHLTLRGVYSTTASQASTAPSTSTGLTPSAVWQDIDNALQEDGTLASITLDLGQIDSFGDNKHIGCGSPYIVLTGFGFSIPSDSLIYGIGLGVKGKQIEVATPNGYIGPPKNCGDQGQVGVYNMALTVGGELFYYADPRSNWDTILGTSPAFTKPGPVSTSPYYQQTLTFGSGIHSGDNLDKLGFAAQPIGGAIGASGTTFSGGWPTYGPSSDVDTLGIMPLGGGTEVFTDPNGVSVNFYPIRMGRLPPCDPNGYLIPGAFSFGSAGQAGVFGPIEKAISASQLKQAWTAAEINHPSFGVAVSLHQGTETFDPLGHFKTAAGLSGITAYLDCLAIAVYYTSASQDNGGGTGGGGGDGGGTGDGTGISVRVSQAPLEVVYTTDSTNTDGGGGGNGGGPTTKVSQTVVEVVLSSSNIGGTPIPCS